MRFIAAVVIALCAACGQSGDLYLPDRAGKAPPVTQPAPSVETEEKKKDTP